MPIPRSPADLRELAAVNARTYAMTEEDRDQWYRDHPLSEYEAAARDSGWAPDDDDGTA